MNLRFFLQAKIASSLSLLAMTRLGFVLLKPLKLLLLFLYLASSTTFSSFFSSSLSLLFSFSSPFDSFVPFDSSSSADYDMRGFWKALQSGDKRAKPEDNVYDQRLHFPDYWKTPYHATFSAESQWADPKAAPRWRGPIYAMPNGNTLYNEQTKTWLGPQPPWGQ